MAPRAIKASNPKLQLIASHQFGLAAVRVGDFSAPLWLGFFKNQRDATAAGFDEVDSELGQCIAAHDAGLRGKSRLRGTVGPKRQQAVVEYLAVAGLGSLTQKRVFDKVVHGRLLFWQREQKGCCDLRGNAETPR